MADNVPAPNTKSRRIRLTATARRAQIIDAAVELFVSAGIEKTSMRAIALEVGITAAGIYQHFADKEAIMREIAHRYFDGFLAYLAEMQVGVEDPLARFRAGLRAYIHHGLAHKDEYRLVFMTPIMGTGITHRIPQGQESVISPTRGVDAFGSLVGATKDLITAGVIRPGDPELMAEIVWASVHGLVSLLITHENVSFSALDRLVDAQMDLVVAGLKA